MSVRKKLPKDCGIIISLMKEIGVVQFELKAVNQLLEFAYRYATSILEEARLYARYADREVITVADIKLAIQSISEKRSSELPSRQLLKQIAYDINIEPIRLVSSRVGLRIPPDRFNTTSANHRVKRRRYF